MKFVARLCSVLLFAWIVGVLLAGVVRKLTQTKPNPAPIKTLKVNETYQWEKK